MAQIATITVETAGGPVDLPVYEPGDSGSNRLEAFRVQTASGPGFVPLAAVDEADRPYLRVQTSSGVRAVDTSASGIPDSGDLHARYDATELSLNDGGAVSTWADETGNGYDLTAGTAPTFVADGINGNPVVRFDGVDDFLDVNFGTLTQPYHIFLVGQFNQTPSSSSNEYIFDRFADNPQVVLYNREGNWSMFSGSVLNDGTADTSPHGFSVVYDGANSAISVDGSSTTGDAGPNDLTGITIGSSGAQEEFGPVDVGEILVYSVDERSNESDIEAYLSDKWGITFA